MVALSDYLAFDAKNLRRHFFHRYVVRVRRDFLLALVILQFIFFIFSTTLLGWFLSASHSARTRPYSTSTQECAFTFRAKKSVQNGWPTVCTSHVCTNTRRFASKPDRKQKRRSRRKMQRAVSSSKSFHGFISGFVIISLVSYLFLPVFV